jgi:cbb3-type cytochrome oxidase cytochrome c subunit
MANTQNLVNSFTTGHSNGVVNVQVQICTEWVENILNSWHYNHMYDPTSMAPGSIMPTYPWLAYKGSEHKLIPQLKSRSLQSLGTPYPDGFADKAVDDLKAQAKKISESLAKDKISQEGSGKQGDCGVDKLICSDWVLILRLKTPSK